jgi:hypothetical protein
MQENKSAHQKQYIEQNKTRERCCPQNGKLIKKGEVG